MNTTGNGTLKNYISLHGLKSNADLKLNVKIFQKGEGEHLFNWSKRRHISKYESVKSDQENLKWDYVLYYLSGLK